MSDFPTELLSHIFEYACSDDFGETARHLGLVSKFFRAIAEPIELRTIKISGLEQLQWFFARLENLYGPTTVPGLDKTPFYVEHLFISELTAKHALTAETACGGRYTCGDYWETQEGRTVKEFYDSHAVDFWNKATALIQCTSSSLRTLTLLSAEFRECLYKEVPSPKVLGALNNVTLPNLVSLTVNHDACLENDMLVDGDALFQRLVVPSLRSLHVNSPVFLQGLELDHRPIHPILATVLTEAQEIQHLTICDGWMQSANDVLGGIFGSKWEESVRRRKLPGKLQTVVLQQGSMPYFGCGTGLWRYRQQTQNIVTAVRELRIDGLEAHLPTARYPELGRREYELLLAEWKEEKLKHY